MGMRQCIMCSTCSPVSGSPRITGFYQAPADLMKGLRAICDEHAIVLIAHEVQTGFARTGALFAMQHYDVVADITNRVRAHAQAHNLILLTCGVYGNVIRFLAPLTIEDNVFAEALDIMKPPLMPPGRPEHAQTQ